MMLMLLECSTVCGTVANLRTEMSRESFGGHLERDLSVQSVIVGGSFLVSAELAVSRVR